MSSMTAAKTFAATTEGAALMEATNKLLQASVEAGYVENTLDAKSKAYERIITELLDLDRELGGKYEAAFTAAKKLV